MYTGDGKQLLRRARMYNVTIYDTTPGEAAKAAEQFSLFDPNELRCREYFIKYWLKGRSEVAKADVQTLEQLRKHFVEKPSTGMTAGEQLKRINMLLQVDWMLDDPNGLNEDFREYTRLLRANGLGRVVLFGAENLIETTARWGQPDTADKLLPVWLDAALAENDAAAVLDFASASLTRGSLWTTAKLLEGALRRDALPAEQRFAAEALRCIALSRISGMARKPEDIKNDVDIARTRWALWGRTEGELHEELRASIADAQKSFGGIERPTRQDQVLKKKLDAIERNLRRDGSNGQ